MKVWNWEGFWSYFNNLDLLEVFMVVAILYLAMTTCWDFVRRRIEAYYGKAYGAAADKQLAPTIADGVGHSRGGGGGK